MGDVASTYFQVLYLRERDFVADLNRLQIADRRLILQLKSLQRRPLGLDVLSLCLSRSEGSIERIERRLGGGLRALNSGSRCGTEARI